MSADFIGKRGKIAIFPLAGTGRRSAPGLMITERPKPQRNPVRS